MSLIVATMNLGNFLQPNVRESLAAAAARWDADYVEITRPWGLSRMLWLCKLELHHYPWPAHSRVCYLDADVLVRGDCPSPFDLVPEHALGAVNGLQNGGESVARKWWDDIGRRFAALPEFDAATYFNGGVMVFTPAIHRAIWEFAWTASVSADRAGPMIEQTAVNIAARALQTPLALMPETMNRLGPCVWDGGVMQDYVYHFANTKGEHRDRDERLASLDWRLVSENEVAVS